MIHLPKRVSLSAKQDRAQLNFLISLGSHSTNYRFSTADGNEVEDTFFFAAKSKESMIYPPAKLLQIGSDALFTNSSWMPLALIVIFFSNYGRHKK